MVRPDRSASRRDDPSPRNTSPRHAAEAKRETRGSGKRAASAAASGKKTRDSAPAPPPTPQDKLEGLLARVMERLHDGAPVPERCSMMNEILAALNASERSCEIRERAIEALLLLARRADHESPCTRGLREMSERMGVLDGQGPEGAGCRGKPRP